MPNWCNNSLTISHKDADTLDNLMAQVRADGDERLFQHIKPMPEELRDTTSPSDSPNWYDWSVDNWGTKWDACSMDYEEYDGIVTFSFDTAWSPPLPVYEALADMGFEVQAYYVEFGMMYAGSWHCNADGEVSEEKCLKNIQMTSVNLCHRMWMRSLESQSNLKNGKNLIRRLHNE